MIHAKTYYIVTFGCQMNERDSETLAGMLEEMGYVLTEDKTKADVVLLNTCSVRENADKRFFGVLGQLKHVHMERPDMTVGVCGCMMQQDHVTTTLQKKYPWVDLVFGTHNIHRFPQMLQEVRQRNVNLVDVWDEGGAIVEHLPAKRIDPYKAYVNIMYGCNNFCTYCIVPYTRGRERSRQPEEILQEVRLLAQSGTKEVTLLGQNVNSYGKSSHGVGSYHSDESRGGMDFSGLIREIDAIPGIERIRFMTSHPKDISADLIQAYGECAHLCKHIHLPVQSGSDRILAKMNRHYSRKQYLDIVAQLRDVCPDIAVTTDIIVGFPGETEEDFQDTMDLVRRVRYDSAFTFLYSPRKGTPAEHYADQIPSEIQHDRFNRLIGEIHSIQEEKSAAYQGKILSVLVEGPSRTNPEIFTGRTDSSKIVDFPGTSAMTGKILPVRITRARTFSLYGRVEGEDELQAQRSPAE
ncbi:MAG TPA: tRNA (N6-isopentenyl adenosine(37)-C2)-methylthiotransferase MiaB [Clostridiales bacterium]|nr:tRNA (N6-isopentenyl adenosine(37)-C2)-methylthiotransferase MiaB [Clostridiales bacterium]